MSWSKLTLPNASELKQLVEEARESVRTGAPAGVGVFKAREELTLYFSPVATMAIQSTRNLALIECGRPNEIAVEVVCGPYDEPAWYDQAEEAMEDERSMSVLDDLGYLGPDFDLDEARELFLSHDQEVVAA